MNAEHTLSTWNTGVIGIRFHHSLHTSVDMIHCNQQQCIHRRVKSVKNPQISFQKFGQRLDNLVDVTSALSYAIFSCNLANVLAIIPSKFLNFLLLDSEI